MNRDARPPGAPFADEAPSDDEAAFEARGFTFGTESEVESAPVSDARLPATQLPDTLRSARRESPSPESDVVHPELVDESAYTLGEEIGRGALGRVMRALDLRLWRPVAVKELLRGGPDAESRFAREARITARLQHPAVVPVYQLGRSATGRPYYVMKLVEGSTLAAAIERAPSFDARLALLGHAVAVADAMAYAHSNGIIHRDLKPSNVLVGPFGETWVADWGLAKEIGVRDDLAPDSESLSTPFSTRTGAVLGTPAYMAPEQARGEEVDERADVYALGSLLHHVLSGRPPYLGDSSAVVEALLLGPPEPLERREPRVPRDLAIIVKKAMARDSSERYPNAGALAEDLRRFQTGQMVSAARYTPSQRAARFLRRHKGASLVALVSAAVFAVSGVVSVEQIVREKDTAKERTRALTLVQARTALDRDPTAALAWLKTYPLDELGPDEDRFRAVAADAFARGVAKDVLEHGVKVEWGVFTPDGRFALTLTDGFIHVFEVATGRWVRALRAEDPLELLFTPDGRRIVARGRRGALEVFPGVDLASGRWLDAGEVARLTFHGDRGWTQDHRLVGDDRATLASLDGIVRVFALDATSTSAPGAVQILGRHEAAVRSVDGSRDGRWVLSGGDDRQVLAFDLTTGRTAKAWRFERPIEIVRLTPDARWALVADDQGRVFRIAMDALDRPPARAFELGSGLAGPCFSPDGRFFATGGDGGRVALYDLETGRVRRFEGLADEILTLDFSPDGRRIVAAGLDRVAFIWDLATGVGRRLVGHNGILESANFSSDGRFLLTTSQDMTARIWRVAEDGWRALPGHTDDINHVRFSPDGRMVATGSEDQTVRLWDRRTGESWVLTGPTDQVYGLAYDPQGRFLVASGYGVELQLWPLDADGRADPERLRVLRGHTGTVWRTLFLPDGRAFLSASGDGTVRLWDVERLEGRVLEKREGGVPWLDVSPDGRWVASAGEDHFVGLTDLSTGEHRLIEGHKDVVHRVFFSPDGRSLASSSWDGTVRILDLETRATRVLSGHDGRVRSLAWSPDGRHLATGDSGGYARVWDAETGEGVVLGRHDAYIRTLAFSPDSRLLATMGWDETVRLFDVEARVLVGLQRHQDIIMSIAFSPDAGSGPLRGELASVGYEHVLDLQPIAVLATLPPTRAGLPEWLESATAARITPDNVPRSERTSR